MMVALGKDGFHRDQGGKVHALADSFPLVTLCGIADPPFESLFTYSHPPCVVHCTECLRLRLPGSLPMSR